jgi:hypothetical protein
MNRLRRTPRVERKVVGMLDRRRGHVYTYPPEPPLLFGFVAAKTTCLKQCLSPVSPRYPKRSRTRGRGCGRNSVAFRAESQETTGGLAMVMPCYASRIDAPCQLAFSPSLSTTRCKAWGKSFTIIGPEILSVSKPSFLSDFVIDSSFAFAFFDRWCIDESQKTSTWLSGK